MTVMKYTARLLNYLKLVVLQEVEDEKEHQETLANNYKRAQQKQAEEIADLKVNLEHIQSRNSELERKQKRFDQVT